MMFTIFPYFLRMHFPGDVYLWCLFQGFNLNKEEWAAEWSTEVAFSCALECRGLGWPGACPPAGCLPADGCRSLMEESTPLHALTHAPQKITAKLSARRIPDSSASRAVLPPPASPNDCCNPRGRALRGSQRKAVMLL